MSNCKHEENLNQCTYELLLHRQHIYLVVVGLRIILIIILQLVWIELI